MIAKRIVRRGGVVLAIACCAIMIAPIGAQEPPADTATAGQAVVDLLAKQDFAGAFARFDATMKTALPEDRLRATWAGLIAQYGAFKRQVSTRVESRGPLRMAIVTCEFERGPLDVQIVVDAAGAVSGLSMRPPAVAYSPPPYVTPSAYTEEDVTVGAVGWPLPGSLTMPTSSGPHAAVVLVHGSGPGDRDESLGANKPFRDLALGLASRGVAVLRYDKRTRVHAARMAAMATMTVKDESIDDAVAAAAWLRTRPGVDPARVFVLGHSLGGMLIPRIAAADPKAAGFIVMAGAARALEDAMVEQTRYLINADGAVSVEEQRQLDLLLDLAKAVKGLAPSTTPDPRSIGGAPASYWLDLRGYDPPAAARAITARLLVLQGERDYQVTMAEFDRWKQALAGTSTVTFHAYASLNHLFMPGTGPSLPTEYERPGHVLEDVVRDIAAWIASGR